MARAKTAWELLERVIEHIREEPRRYFQDAWVLRNEREIRERLNYVPACGTVACRAGWIVALHDGLDAAAFRQEVTAALRSPVLDRANTILGMHSCSTLELFHAGTVAGKPGTKAYVRQGIAGLRAFMEEHATHLKARDLKGV